MPQIRISFAECCPVRPDIRRAAAPLADLDPLFSSLRFFFPSFLSFIFVFLFLMPRVFFCFYFFSLFLPLKFVMSLSSQSFLFLSASRPLRRLGGYNWLQENRDREQRVDWRRFIFIFSGSLYRKRRILAYGACGHYILITFTLDILHLKRKRARLYSHFVIFFAFFVFFSIS